MSDGSDRNQPDAVPEGTPRGVEDDRVEARDISEAARRAAERAAGRALDEPGPLASDRPESSESMPGVPRADGAPDDPAGDPAGDPPDDPAADPAPLPEGARRVWAEHLFVHGLLSALTEIESNPDAREARVETVMNAVRRSPAKARRPWLHYVAAAAVLLFLIIGGLQLFQRDAAPDLSSLEAAIEAQAEDVDLEYRGEVAIERAGEPLESLPCQFITGPDRFYVKTQFPSPMGSIPIEFGALDGQRWVNIMGFAIDASRLEEGLSRMGPMAGVGRHSPRGLVDPMRLLTDLGALLRRMRESCDVEVSDGGVAEDGERLTRVLGTPRDPHDAHAVQSIEVFVGRTSDVVKSFTIVCVPPKGPIAETKPTPGANDRRSRFRERLRQRRSHQLSVQHVTLTCRLVRTFRAERTLFLPAELDASPEADPGDDGPGEDGRDQKR